MDYRLLGPVEVVDGERPVDLGPRKQRALLSLLLLHVNTVVTTDRILEDLWGDEALSKENALWVIVSRLRSALEPGLAKAADSTILLTHGHGYELRIDPSQIDASRFEEALDKARDTFESGPVDASAQLTAALAEWRGAPVEEFVHEDFARHHVYRLEELRREAVELRAEAELRLGRGREQISELEALHAAHPLQEPIVDLLMRAMYQAGRHADALRVFGDHRRAVGEGLGLEPSPELRRLEERILLHDPTVVPSGASPMTTPADPAGTFAPNPYKGLRTFHEEDAADFHGRHDLVAELVRRVESGPLIILIGPSGSGKSSVVRAGLVPSLRHGEAEGSAGWVIAQMVPGAHPFAEAEAALVRAAGDAASRLGGLARDADFLVGAARRLLPNEDGVLVIVIDQFEELFSLVHDGAPRAAFLDAVVTAIDDPHERVRFVLTVRADFYQQLLGAPGLGSRLNDTVVNVTPLTSEELERAALLPASRAGVTFEPSLLRQLIADVERQPGGLPLFQFALTELYDRREDTTLTSAAYRDIGGVSGALARRADEVFAGLSQDRRYVAHQVFLRLLTVHEDGTALRRRVRGSEIIELDIDVVAAQEVIEQFGRDRLLSFDMDNESGAPTVEIAHEALLTGWPTLARWVDDDVDNLRRLASLRSLIPGWIAADRHPEYLISGARLEEFLAWRAGRSLTLTDSEQAYLDAATARRDEETAAAEQQREREVRQRQRDLRRLRTTLVVVTMALGLASAGGVFALIERGRANDRAAESDLQAVISAAQADAARAIGLTARDPALALALVAQAYAAVDPPPLGVVQALVEVREATDSGSWTALEPALTSRLDLIYTIGLSPDASTVVVGGAVDATQDSAPVLRLDAESGERVAPDLVGHDEDVLVNAFSPSGTFLVTGDAGGKVILWNLETNTTIATSDSSHSSRVSAASFSPDGQTIVTADWDGEIRLWDGHTLAPLPNLYDGFEVPVLDIAFDHDGTRIAFAGGPADEDSTVGNRASVHPARLDAGFIHVADTATGRLVAASDTVFLQRSIAFSGSLLVTAGGSLSVGNSGFGIRRIDGSTLTVLGSSGFILAHNVAFNLDGSRLIATWGDKLSDISREELVEGTLRATFVSLGAPPSVEDLWSIRVTGDRIVAARASSDGVQLMSRSYGRSLGTSTTADIGSLRAVAFSADGRSVTMAGADGVQTSSATDPSKLRSPQLPGRKVLDVAQSPTGTVAAIDSAGRVWIWDSADTAATPSLIDQRTPGLGAALAFSSDGLLAVARGTEISLYQAPSGTLVGGFSAGGYVERGTDLVFTPDGTALIIGGLSGNLAVIDLEGKALSRTVLRAAINAVAVDEAGGLIATAGSDNTTRLWDLGTLQPRGPALDHTAPVSDVRFSNNGAVLIAADASGAVRFWDPRTGAPIGGPQLGHTLRVRGLDVSPDGKLIASVSTDGTLRIYDLLDPDAACRIAESGIDFPEPGEPAEHGLQYCAEVVRD